MKITIENLSAAYRGVPVLEGVSFSAEEGKITALLGRNGAGKTTLLRCITGEKRDYGGRIFLNGENANQFPRRELARMVAYLPQNLPRPHVTVKELVAFGRTPYLGLGGCRSSEDARLIRWAMDVVGLTLRKDTFVDTLSGGERKKAFFAMTLAQDTPVVVLDEPTAHLDTASRFEFLERISGLCQATGKTFLVVMHDLPEVFRYAHRVVVLSGCRVVFDGSPECCLAEHIPEEHFGIALTGTRETGYGVRPI